jgi:hypothetical protein
MRKQVGYVARATGVMLGHPLAGVERVRGRIDRRGDARALRAAGLPVESLYPVDADWLRHLHEVKAWPWPCPTLAEGEQIRAEVMAMFAAKGLPERYQNWCDGGEAFTKAAWCLTMHLKPQTVVETGVARGVTSRLILEALARCGAGRLCSVDLPTGDSSFHPQIAIAVPEQLRTGWTLRSGTSRHQLPRLLDELGAIDLFVHDSLHTGRNTSFELGHAWQVLRPGGALLVDDAYQSLAFRKFVDTTRLRWSCIGANPNGGYPFGIAIAEGDLAENLKTRLRDVTGAGAPEAPTGVPGRTGLFSVGREGLEPSTLGLRVPCSTS